MTETPPAAPPQTPETPPQTPGAGDRPPEKGLFTGANQTPSLIYVLYLAGLVTGFTPIIGVVMAYVSGKEASPALQSHYRYQIRTFWIALVAGLISFVLMFVLIGFLTGLAAAIWFIIRCAKGLARLNEGQAIEDPESWWI